jgi:autotransporter-associated beta strand protein
MNFNGGVLKTINNAFASTFLNGLTAAYVRNGGAVIDNNGFAITVGQALLHSAILGDNVTDGGLIATNSGSGGSLTVSGANTYNGPTIVKSGANLATTTASTGAGSYSVSDSAILNVQVVASGGQLAMSSLTEGTSGNLTNIFTLGANASTTTPAVAVGGAINVNGTILVNVTGSGLTGPNTYLLLSYGSSSGSGSFVAGTVPTVAGCISMVTNDTSAQQLKLVYTIAPQSVKWAVGNGNWDTTTLNWQLLAGGGAANYVENALAAFDDSASGSSPITVTLTASHTPSVVTNNSSAINYLIAGSSYNLTGAPLIKDGSSTLTLDNGSGNSFTSIAIDSGTLQVGNGDANGSLGSGAVTNNATLAFNRTDTGLTLANVISGSGGVSQNGSGAVTLSGANTYSGPTTINSGQLVIGNAAALQSSPVNNNVANGLGFASSITAGAIAGLTGTGNITLTNAANAAVTLTVSSTNVSTTFGGNLLGGTLVKQGTNTTLTLTNNSTLSSLTVGSAMVGGTLLVTNGTLSVGDGTTSSSLQIAAGAGTTSLFSGTLDVSAAAGFTANVGNFFVFNSPSGATPSASSGTLVLGTNNNITALNEVRVGEHDSNPTTGGFVTTAGSGITTIVTPLMTIAHNKASGSFILGAGSTLNLSGTNGGRAVLNIENQGASSPTSFTGTMDLTGGGTGVFNAVLSSLAIGNHTGANTGGSTGSATGSLLLSGSANNHLDICGAGNVVVVGGRTNSLLGFGVGTLTIGNLDAASSVVSTNNSTAILLGNGANSVGTLNLNGGTLTVTTTGSGIAGGSGLSTNNYNGVTLKAGTNSATFLTSLTAANVLINGVSFDSAGFNITVPQPLLAGDAFNGGLTKLGNGTLTLSGTNTYTGNTVVSGGLLQISGSILGTATVNSGGALGGNGGIGGATTINAGGILLPGNSSLGTLTFSNNLALSATSTNDFVVTTVGGASNLAAVLGTLTPNSSVVEITSGMALGVGTNTLFTYAGISGAFNATPVFDVAPVHPASIVDNGSGQINLVVPNQPPVATSFALGVVAGIPVTVQVIGGKYPPTDPDGDALTITAVGGEANGTAMTDGTNITYMATNAATTDSFTYTVSDGFGGTAVGTISVIINSAQGYNLVQAQSIGGNAVLTYAGIPAYNYALDWTHSLSYPITWMPLFTNAASSSDGSLMFTNMPSGGSDFYRTRYVP